MLLLLGLIVSGCATNQRVSPPDWEFAYYDKVETVDPVELPALCEIPFTTAECYLQLEKYEIVAEGNFDIAKANTNALRKAEGAYNELVAAGKMQQEYAELREEQLQEERREHMLDNWWHRGLIVLIGIGAAAK